MKKNKKRMSNLRFQAKTKHFSALLVKNSKINFEESVSISDLLDFKRNGAKSRLAQELIAIIGDLMSNPRVKTISLRSFLLSEQSSEPILEILQNRFGAICVEKRSNFFIDYLSFLATSIKLRNFKNLKRRRAIVKQCTIKK